MAAHIACIYPGVTMRIKPVPKFHNGRLGAALAVRVKANARITRIRKIDSEGTIFIDIASSETNEIDTQLKKFLAGELGVKLSQLDVIGSDNSNARLVMILGMTADDVEQKINQLRG